MSENNNNHAELLLREVLNEALLRDLFLFIILYIFLLAQGWNSLLLLLYPIISFSFSLFFRIIGTNKKRLKSNSNLIYYNPMGIENKNANRLFFVSLLQLILLFWIGAESIYHPQLIEDFSLYFNITYFLIYSFGFFWIFIGIWNNCKIILDLNDLEEKNLEKENLVISELKFKRIELISYLNIIVFILLNLINAIFILINDLGINVSFTEILPGTGIEDSEPLYLPFTVLIFLIASPLMTGILIKIIYYEVSSLSELEIKSRIKNLPSEIQTQIIENLKSINRKSVDDEFVEK